MYITDFEKIIKQINKLLSQKYKGFKGSYFFGSRAKGSHSSDSDYDVVLTFEKELHWKEKKTIYGIINDFEIENDIIIDVHIYKLKDILEPVTPFRYNVKNEGVFYGD